MAPRSAKAKKTADVKVSVNEAPTKGKKGKNLEEPLIETKEVINEDEQAPVTEKKSKRGKRKAGNEQESLNNKDDEIVPPTKKGKKDSGEETSDDAPSTNEPTENSVATNNHNGDLVATNGDVEENVPTGRGRNKQTKKDPTEKVSDVKSVRGRKNAKKDKVVNEVAEDTEMTEEKPAPKRRGRKAQVKVDMDVDTEEKTEKEEDVKPEPPVAKGRKKAVKAKEKSPEPEKEESQEENQDEGKIDEEPKKKEVKGRKNKSKKAKEDVKEAEEEKEEPEKEEKGDGDAKSETADEPTENTPELEVKPTKGKRGPKKKAADVVDDEPQDTGEPKKKKRVRSEDAEAAPPKNKSATDYEKIDFSNTSKNAQEREWNFKISSWNVDGIRAWLSKGGLDFIKYEKPDILCLQETKCSQEKLPEEITNLPGYHAYWLCSDKDGYAGVGIYTTKLAMNVQYGLQNEELDSEGRIITAEYEHFYLICTYVPNAGRNLVTLPKRLKWNEEFRKYVNDLDKKKPVIICGDMNVAHNEIDLANPKTNKKNAGFTIEERTGMSELLGDGFVDTYRHLYPDKTDAYTFWTYMKNCRAKNVGWRLDYFIVSKRLLPSLCDSLIRDSVYGSDHCPISLFLHLTSADKPK